MEGRGGDGQSSLLKVEHNGQSTNRDRVADEERARGQVRFKDIESSEKVLLCVLGGGDQRVASGVANDRVAQDIGGELNLLQGEVHPSVDLRLLEEGLAQKIGAHVHACDIAGSAICGCGCGCDVVVWCGVVWCER